MHDEEFEEYKEEIRNTVKVFIYTLEIFIDELEKSNLPEKYKELILTQYINKSDK